jgi:hypothetical protein
MDFIIRKDTFGNWIHELVGMPSKPLVSDFECLIDFGLNTFIIQCFNGSNIPSQSIPIADVQVIDESISLLPIPFSGAVGLKNLLTSKNYTPFVTAGSGGSQNLAQVLAVDNKTNSIPIVSNDGTSYVLIDENGSIVIQSFDGVKQLNIAVDSFLFNSDYRFVFQGKGIDINTTSDGFGLPRLTTTQMNAIVLPTNGMIVWNTTELAIYQYNGTIWEAVGGGGGTWGSITGTLSDQTDLQTALDAKVDKVAGSRLITSAESTLLGNTSGTNSGDNATNTKYEVTAATGAVIAFDTRKIYNTIASPSSSNITDNLTGAQIGIVQKIYHNAGTAPTFPAGWVKRGTGSYVTSTLNIIYAEWSVGTTVEYWITQ